jgi:6-phosphofructokinase 1
MGRHAGFLAAGVTGRQDVNFTGAGERLSDWTAARLSAALKNASLSGRMRVIVAAEGPDIARAHGGPTRRLRQMKLNDIALFLRERIEAYFKSEKIPIVMRYFDPSYLVRSSPANSEDSILCDLFARHAAHAAMAGKTGLVIGYLHDRFIHVPSELLTSRKKRLDPDGFAWRAVLAATGQPKDSNSRTKPYDHRRRHLPDRPAR